MSLTKAKIYNTVTHDLSLINHLNFIIIYINTLRKQNSLDI